MKQPFEEFSDGIASVRAALDLLRAEMEKRAEEEYELEQREEVEREDGL